jgi:hypothetical protein
MQATAYARRTQQTGVGSRKRITRAAPSRFASRPISNPRVPDTWPPPGPRKRPATLEHVGDLWTLNFAQSTCTAAIWRNDFGLELRVLHGDELVESRLSRFGETPLPLISDELKANLIEQGWTETPNATGSPANTQ